MIVNEQMLQGSDEWFRIRQARPTASEFVRIVTPKTGAPSSQRTEYMRELYAESFIPDENCVENSWAYTGKKWIGNRFTDHGNEFEPEAREAFAQRTGLNVFEVGFVTRDDGIVGCSPDGLIKGPDGIWVAGLEIKCKCLKNHIEVLETGDLPAEHKPQVHGSLAVTGLPEWHFWSYFPGTIPAHVVVTPDDYTEKVSEALDAFLMDYSEYFKRMKGKLFEIQPTEQLEDVL